MALDIIFIIIGFILLVKGADFLVDGGSNIAKKFNIPEIVIGMTIVSIGTSMPELVVSVNSALNGLSDISLGNVIGSNLANLFLILGLCAIVKPLPFEKQTKDIENWIALTAVGLFLFFATDDNIISKTEGSILLGLCVLFIIYNIIMAKVGQKFDDAPEETKDEKEKISIMKSLFFVVLGCVGLKFGGDFVVNSAVNIAKDFGITEKLISVTIIAIGTSLPELVTSVTATRRGDVDMAIGNIIGSNVFNILLIIGTSAFLNPINYSMTYNKDFILLSIGTLLLCLFPFIGKKDTMTRKNGFIFFLLYLAYFGYNVFFM